MNRTDLDISLYELSLDVELLQLNLLKEKTIQHIKQCVMLNRENDTIPQAKYLTTTLIFIEELNEFATELINHNSHLGSRLGILEEMADVTLCVDEFLAELQIDNNFDIKKEEYHGIIVPELQNEICMFEILKLQKLLTKYLRGQIDFVQDSYYKQSLTKTISNLYALMNNIKDDFNISDDELIRTRYIKTQNFINHSKSTQNTNES